MSLRNTLDKINRYFWFTKTELAHFIILATLLGFIYSFNNWGENTFNLTEGLWNLIEAIILVGITIFIHHAGQRLAGIKLGYKTEQKNSWNLTAVSIIVCIITNGAVRILLGSGTNTTLMQKHRIGEVRYGPNLSQKAIICAAGPLFNVIFAIIFVILGLTLIIPTSMAEELFSLNLWFAVCNLLPIPPLDGTHIFFASRTSYIFIFSTIATYAILSFILPAYIFIAAIAIGAIITYLWTTTYEK